MSGIAVQQVAAQEPANPSTRHPKAWLSRLRACTAGLAILIGLSTPLTLATPATAAPGTYTYVTNFSSNNVSVIDTTNNTVLTTIPVGTQPFGVAISPDGARAYVTNLDSDNVSVINTTDNTVL
ncbi:YncE family protein, partial [Streptomyces sp. NPDC127084]|uniref:YncE family protein n=1 Tax=Streptomyces sp. NPDC127084 TaxID=3347133 RepID=UPI00365B1D1E